jgi:MFS family permease
MDGRDLSLRAFPVAPEVIGGRSGLGLAVPMVCTSAVGVATGMIWPLLSLRLDQMGFDSGSIGLSASVQSAAGLAVAPVVPDLLCRCGMTRLVAAGLLGIVVCLLLFPAFPSFDGWLGLRAAFGAGVSIVSIATPVWITALARDGNKGTIIGVFGLLWSAGFATGPCIIGAAPSAGWLPFVESAGVVTIAALPLVMWQFDAPVTIPCSATHWGPVARNITTPALVAALMLGVLDSANDSFLPLYGLRNGLDERSAVLMLVTVQIGTMAAQLPIGWLADRVSNARLMLSLAGVGTLALGFVGLAARDTLWRLADLGVLGFAIGGIWTTSIVLLAEQFDERERAVGNMARVLLYGLGGMLFLPLVGSAIDKFSADALPVAGAAAFFLLGISCSRGSA